MFGGMVEALGEIQKITHEKDCLHFTITPRIAFDDLVLGDSVSVNGVCLTVTALDAKTFSVTAVPETLRLTNLGKLTEQSIVNLERALKINARLGGHFVQGHIDAIGEIIDIKNDGKNALLVHIRIPEKLAKYIINKGYIGIDGMSITVIDAMPDSFSVTFIPYTQASSIVNQYKVGTLVNIEVDMMGKYLEKLCAPHKT